MAKVVVRFHSLAVMRDHNRKVCVLLMATLSYLKIMRFAVVHFPDLLGDELRPNNSLALPP